MKSNINNSFSLQASATLSSSLKENMRISEQEYQKHLTISKGLSSKSIKTYLTRFRAFANWLQSSKLDLSKQSIETFLYEKKSQGSSSSNINCYIQAINHIIDCYKFYDYQINIIEKIKGLPKKKPKINPLSLDEVNRLLNTHIAYDKNKDYFGRVDYIYLTFTKFLAITACRFDEAASLTVGQLDLDNKRALLNETKNGNSRFLFINGPIIEHLKEIINNKKPDDLVFTNRQGRKIHSGDFGSNLKKRAKLAGISKHINPHLLRHSYATTYYNYTHDIAMVAQILGHKDIQTTYETYVHFDTEGIQMATNRHPLISQYIPTEDALQNIKKAIENLRIADDKRFQFSIGIKNGKLKVNVKVV